MTSGRALLPLAALTFLVALATSRWGLVIHELVGHGGTAVALGGHVREVRLFWFAGGWVSYAPDGTWSTAAVLAVTLGGIAVEGLVAALLALAARRRAGLTRLVLVGAATGFAIHAGLYLAVGTFHGSGDGTFLHQQLGAWRPLVWAPAAAACVAVSWAGVAAAMPILRDLAPAAAPGRQLVVVGLALALGGGLHGALDVVELRLRADPTYTAIMRTESQRDVDREVAAARAAAPEATPAQLDAVRAAAAERHRPPPFTPALIALIAAAGVAAMLRSRPAPAPAPLPWRRLVGPAAVAAAGLAVVIAIDLLT